MKLSFRIIPARFTKDTQFNELLAFLLEHREAVGEISLFTEYWHHGYYPLEQFEPFCEVVTKRIATLRENGFSNVGVNMLCTLGHFDEACNWLPSLPYQAATDHNGIESKSCFCPNSPQFMEYIKRKYELLAQTKPDFIWVDDDVRMHSHGVEYTCFCPICIDKFNHTNGTNIDRQLLVEQLNQPDGAHYREQWIEQNTTVVEQLLEHIAASVHRVDDQIELGFMTVSQVYASYSGPDYERWLRALKATKARPGGGFYDDREPLSLIQKILETSRQTVSFPREIRDLQYEFENFPFQRLSKSIHFGLLECTAALATGLNGIAFDLLKQEEGTLEDYHDWMIGIQKMKPMWSAMAENAGDYVGRGLYPAFSAQFDAKRKVQQEGNWFKPDNGDVLKVYSLSELGIPLSMDANHACGTILTGKMAEGFTTEELRSMLAGGLLIDGRSLQVLWERGLGHLCGVSIRETYDNGVYEQFTDEGFNGRHSGERRDARIAFWKDLAYVVEPLNPEVRIISRLLNFVGEDLGPTFTLFENELGGRVAVHGYAPWKHIHSGVKREQLMKVCDWLTKGILPVIIRKLGKVVPLIQSTPDGSGYSLMLINATMDPTGEFDVEVRTSHTHWSRLAEDGVYTPLTNGRVKNEKDVTIITVDSIGPWEYIILSTQMESERL
ncbi:hypothetical protein [Cohnella abietis]|uniref:Beta-galactosidase trimerisation domain-containing protein n=1 Tax=Cohnella abietis TaxID=2507935 RepID=A0A3T1D3S0_9BACL|nr:hypothetical protein [Cohnella abietis]BBI32766.1 hypothetical protein KCTCHS21_21650 [Cohnella abietis]